MAGAPRFGKMSTRIRCKARTAQSAMARTATTTEMGRRSAAMTNRMRTSLFPNRRQEWGQITLRGGHSEQCSPDTEFGQGVVDFRLCKQALRIGHFGNVAQTRLVPGRGLLFTVACSLELHRRVLGDAARCLKNCSRFCQ